MEFFAYVVVAVVAGYIGWFSRGMSMLANLSRDPDHVIRMLEKIKEINDAEEMGLPDDAIEVQTEQVNDLVYAYNKVTGEFLAQAQNLHQVMVLAASRYPGKKFWHPELKKDHQTA